MAVDAGSNKLTSFIAYIKDSKSANERHLCLCWKVGSKTCFFNQSALRITQCLHTLSQSNCVWAFSDRIRSSVNCQTLRWATLSLMKNTSFFEPEFTLFVSFVVFVWLSLLPFNSFELFPTEATASRSDAAFPRTSLPLACELAATWQ